MSDNLEVDDEESDKGDPDCMYNYAEEDDDEDSDVALDDLLEEEVDTVYVRDDQMMTKPFLFKYERVRLLSDRTKQLELGAKPMLKNVDHLSKREIAELELEKRVIPLIIERGLPGGKIERWPISKFVRV